MVVSFPPFRDAGLRDLALTHASQDAKANNERLEFLGDRVLGLVIAQTLYDTYPNEAEGKLALRHAALVRADCVANRARALDLAAHLKRGGGDPLENMLADGLEALIGALYLDQGFDVAAAFVRDVWADVVAAQIDPPQDPKTTLQEWTQARGLPLPLYSLVTRTGPDHAPEFTISVTVKGQADTLGTAATRRAAEKAAAELMLLTLQDKNKK